MYVDGKGSEKLICGYERPVYKTQIYVSFTEFKSHKYYILIFPSKLNGYKIRHNEHEP
jgi:hypothetical protein